MKPIPYRVGARLADWYHGLRDGWAGIPDRDTAAEPVSTPHREALIRLAQDVFEHERLKYERARGDAPNRIVAATARLDQLRAHKTEAERQLAEVSQPLTSDQETWRRIGDLGRSDLVVIQRRRTEHRRRINAARLTLNSVIAEIGPAEAELAAATERDKRDLRAATAQVLRFHQHTHRRLSCYLRRLLRSHPDGAWAATQLVVPSFLPGWVGQVPQTTAEQVREQSRRPQPPSDEAPSPPPDDLVRLNDHRTTFGSDADKVDVLIDAPGTAPVHFELTRENPDQLRLREFGHGHGPYQHGAQVRRSALLKPGDHFDFADRRYYVRDGCAALDSVPLRPVNLIVADVWAMTRPGGRLSWLSLKPQPRRDPKPRLSAMTFLQRENTLLAVLGPSGAGKSSLFDALIGDLRIDSGSLLLAGLDITSGSSQISDKLGYVPQDIDLHGSLTVRKLLTYSFQLRDPGTRFTRDRRVKRVCADLELVGQMDQLVSTLSGGQRRRVSIAIELLSEPALLILDEPTSGLDPGKDREILRQLRRYAEGGQTRDGRTKDARTVLFSTHATEHLTETADEVLVVADRGQPVFLGRPDWVKADLGVLTYADLMVNLAPVIDPVTNAEKTNPWAVPKVVEYQASSAAGEARREAANGAAPAVIKAVRERSVSPRMGTRARLASWRTFRRQLWTLIKRQATLLKVRGRRNDRRMTLAAWLAAFLSFVIAGVAAVLAALITPGGGLGPKSGQAGSVALSVLTTLAVLSGQALTYGDLVSDFPIIRREHRTGVLLSAVTFSKWLVFLAVAAIQAAVMTAAFTWLRPGPAYSNVFPPWAELFADIGMLSIAAMSLGLLISAMAVKLERAVALVTLTSIAQIALNGVTAQLSRNLNLLAELFPDRWGLAAAASSVDLDRISLPSRTPPDALWQHSTAQWATDMTVLGILAVGYLVLATAVLRRRLRSGTPSRRVHRFMGRRSWSPT